MRVEMAFVTGLVLLWTAPALAGTESIAGGQTDSADYVFIPCGPPDAVTAPIGVAQAEAPILVAQGNPCKTKLGGCAIGAPCGTKKNPGVCRSPNKVNCRCVRTKPK